MQYVAEKTGQTDGWYNWNWRVTCPNGIISPLTEAEANIIAFALNAVADGHGLQLLLDNDTKNGTVAYSGPKSGVTPQIFKSIPRD